MSASENTESMAQARQAMMSAYRSGDYVTALDKTEGLRSGTEKTAPYYFFRGALLRQLGRLQEAEDALRESLFLERHSQQRALALNTLASVLLERQRFAESIAFYELASRAWPDRGASLRGIAEVLLHEGRDFAKALEMARRAVEIDRRAEGLPKDLLNQRLGEDIAVLAWASATNGVDSEQVASMLAESIGLCEGSSVPTQAQLHYHAGSAYMALRKTNDSRRHFAKAAEIDPQGSFGRMARAANDASVTEPKAD